MTPEAAWTFTLRDLLGSLLGIAVLALPMLAPGYLAAYATDIFSFRTRGLREQAAWSVALSLGVGTVALVGLVWLCGVVLAAWLLVVAGAAAAIVVARHWPVSDLCEWRRMLLLGGAWILLVLVSLVDFGHGQQLWMSVTSYDHSVRTAFVGAVMRDGVPPHNPLYWPGHAAPMRYYYFWYVICGVVAKLGRISARQALIASCVWPFFAVLAMLGLYGRHVLGWAGARLRRGWWLAVALMAVTGFDLLLTGLGMLGGGSPPGDLEWWSIAQVSSWADSFLWVPHHVAALVCCLLAVLLLYKKDENERSSQCVVRGVFAGLSVASACGLSSYVAFAGIVLCAGLFVDQWLRVRNGRALVSWGAAVVTAGAALTPYLLQLTRAATSVAGSGAVLGLGVREMLSPRILGGLPEPLSAALLVAPGYLLELGFFAVVLIVALRRGYLRDQAETMLLAATLLTLAVATFVRSNVIATNDFAVRASLLPQFFLLLLGVVVVERASPRLRRVLLMCAVLGVTGTVYQVVMLRVYLPWRQARGDAAERELGERALALRRAFASAALPEAARLQFAPESGYFNDAQMLAADRQVVNADPGCNTSFGGERDACPAIQDAEARLFPANPAKTLSADDALVHCRALDADYLVATRWDAVWNAPQGWVWQLPAVVDQDAARIVACAGKAR